MGAGAIGTFGTYNVSASWTTILSVVWVLFLQVVVIFNFFTTSSSCEFFLFTSVLLHIFVSVELFSFEVSVIVIVAGQSAACGNMWGVFKESSVIAT